LLPGHIEYNAAPAEPAQYSQPVKRTIVFVEQFFYPEGWGGAQIPRDLAIHLARIGNHVEVICGSDQYAPVEGSEGEDPRAAGVRIRRIPSLFGGSIHRFKLLRQMWFYVAVLPLLLLRRRPALLILQTNPPLGVVFGTLMARLWRRPSIIIAMDLYPEVLVANRSIPATSPLARLLKTVFGWSYRGATRVVALGPVMRERLLAKGVDPARIVCIANWSTGSEGIVRGSANRLLSEWGVEGKFVVLYSGNLGIAHEFDTFLRGFAAACAQIPELVLVVIGKGSRLAEFKASVQALGVEPRVRYSDFVAAERMPESIGIADVALVSLREGFEGLVVPSKVYGFMSRGVPVMYVGPRSDVSLTLEDSGCGIVVAPGDPAAVTRGLLAMHADRDSLRALGVAGERAYQADLSAEAALARYDSLVQELIGAASPAAGGTSARAGSGVS
jgi:glycosyltransferase involved in cell wall biosynthesis